MQDIRLHIHTEIDKIIADEEGEINYTEDIGAGGLLWST